VPIPLIPVPESGELRQGEILSNVWVHRAVAPARELREAPDVDQHHHPIAVVLHSDCDLLQDFNARRAGAAENRDPHWSERSIVTQVLMCDAFVVDELRNRGASKDLWARIKNNQDERYHRLEFDPIAVTGTQLSELLLDFRKAFMVHTPDVYAALVADGIVRHGYVPPVYLHDLMQRFFSYHARVGLP